MTELLTAAQMRAIEEAAIESGEVTGLELMERAGRGVVEAIFEEWPELAATSHRAVVLCGPGNNGGDGFVVARLLKAWGWEVEVFLYGDPLKLPADANKNYERWIALGSVQVRVLDPPPLSDDSFVIAPACNVLIDSLFGIGLSRPLKGCFSVLTVPHVKSFLQDKHVKLVSIDTPSGVCANAGKSIGHAFSADLTVTFQYMKLGHVLSEGPHLSGRTVVKDIGLAERADLLRGHDQEWVRSLQAPPTVLFKYSQSNKFNHGHALILSGGPGKGGAARLAARGALRIGAGLVTLGCPPGALQENAAQLNAVMTEPLRDPDALTSMLEDVRINALCIGPGLGRSRAKDLVPAALHVSDLIGERALKRGVVLDADALTAFEDNPDALFQMLHTRCVLTPHAGEFKRLFPDISDKLNAPATKGPAYSKVNATREAAKRAGCVILFKGPDTVIADPSGRCSINSAHYERAVPWLATAGAGDVLAGFIAGLLARGFSPMQAAETAAWLHVECALSFGPGLIAEDLPEELPKVFRTLAV